MSLVATVLFGQPHAAIASLIRSRIVASHSTQIVAGFATPGGLASLNAPTLANKLTKLVIGAATYPAFQALDELLANGVAPSNLRVHLGHTRFTGGRRNPYARYRPMLHSKVYYMDMPGNAACAFIGSHNLTSYALSGLNAEAALMLEGDATDAEFGKVRQHIDAVAREAVAYSYALREAYTWWFKEFLDGLYAELHLPHDWRIVRTILIFASSPQGQTLAPGQEIFFEIPSGISIDNLDTEVHLFVFDVLPASPLDALAQRSTAREQYTCDTLGADNEQGNVEVRVSWRIDRTPLPVLRSVPSGRYRPSTPADMQQVRAKVAASSVELAEYAFEREREGWDPVLEPKDMLLPPADTEYGLALTEAQGGRRSSGGWSLVTDLKPRSGLAAEKDQAALDLARPDSGAFVLVAIRRRQVKEQLGK